MRSFQIQRRCVAETADGKKYFGEVFNSGMQRVYLDPEDPRRTQAPVQYVYVYGGARGGKTQQMYDNPNVVIGIGNDFIVRQF